MDKEIWKDIPNYEGLYQASTLGRIKSLEKNVWNRWQYVIKKEKILQPRHNGKGYITYALFKNGMRKDFKGHYLVLSTFIENIENKPQINHINGIKDDNRLCNLEYCNNSENQKHAIKLGLRKIRYGSECKCAKPIYQYDLNGNFIKKWNSRIEAKKFYKKYIHFEREKSIGYLWKDIFI